MNESPLGWLATGIIVCAASGGLFAIDVPVAAAYAVLAIGSLLVQVAIIATGVEWGLRRHDHVKATAKS